MLVVGSFRRSRHAILEQLMEGQFPFLRPRAETAMVLVPILPDYARLLHTEVVDTGALKVRSLHTPSNFGSAVHVPTCK